MYLIIAPGIWRSNGKRATYSWQRSNNKHINSSFHNFIITHTFSLALEMVLIHEIHLQAWYHFGRGTIAVVRIFLHEHWIRVELTDIDW